jgi:c(7)-type cytochrome triheme protein
MIWKKMTLRAENNLFQSLKGYMPLRRWVEFAVFVLACFAFAYIFVFSSKANDESENNSNESSPMLVENLNQDFSKFQHANPQHTRLPCLLCHKRENNSPVPKLSGHLPCAGCHTAQFADKKNPICTICHTNTETGSVKRFPALRSFNVLFDHAKHLRYASCATCHKPSRKGVALSMPSGLNAHVTCYQCHTPRKEIGERNISSCGVCHQQGRPSRNSDWAKAYNVNFSHAKHGSNQKLNCAGCHSVKAGASRGKQVTAPLVSMHFAPSKTQSCASCHNNKKAFGGDDFLDCKRCHRGNNFGFS